MTFPKCSILAPAVLVAAWASLAGCSEAGAPGTVEISGTVTLDGQPVDQAAVAFIGNEGARLATAQTDKSGKFKMRASLGKNLVTVTKEVAPSVMPAVVNESDNLMPSDSEYQKMQTNKPKPGIPAKYADPKTSGIAMEVVEGMKDIELALSSK
jgi:hypothetical protein